MGPIGILCIQRTLNNGRHSGLFTGVGAAISDLFYCLLVGLGISLVTDFIADHVNVLQIIGSVILIVYAVYMIFHNPVSQIKENIDQRNDHWRDMVTGFLFTLSNPLVVGASKTISIFVYERGIQGSQFSLSTAVGLFQSVVCVIFLLLSNWLAKKFGERGVW